MVGGGLIGYVKSKPLRNGQIISIDVLVVLMIIAVFHEKLIWPPVRALSKLKRHLLDLTLWTTVLWATTAIDRWRHICFHWLLRSKQMVAPSINCSYRPQNCSSESEIQQMALQFWNGPYGGSNQLFMKNGYDHHEHQDIYTYNLSVPERFTLDVPNQSPPYFQKLFENNRKHTTVCERYQVILQLAVMKLWLWLCSRFGQKNWQQRVARQWSWCILIPFFLLLKVAPGDNIKARNLNLSSLTFRNLTT